MPSYLVGIGLALTFGDPPVLPALEASVTHRIELRSGREIWIGGHARFAYEQRMWDSQDVYPGCTGTSGGATGVEHLGGLDLGAVVELRGDITMLQLWAGVHVAAGMSDISYTEMDTDPRCIRPPSKKEFVTRAAPAAGIVLAAEAVNRVFVFLHVQGTIPTVDENYASYQYFAVTAGVAVRR
jgi:hypothetical protein